MGFFGGFKSLMFGGKILQTIGSVTGKSRGLVNSELKVHVLENRSDPNGKMVALELVQKAFLNYHTSWITLSKNETRNLITFLNHSVHQ